MESSSGTSGRKRRNSDENSGREQKQFISGDREDDTKKKMLDVIRREFLRELDKRENELEEIDERLKEALRIQHFLRYAVVSSYYGVRSSQGDWPDAPSNKQVVHPAVSGLGRKGKSDKEASIEGGGDSESDVQAEDKSDTKEDPYVPTKIPRYVPPASKPEAQTATSPTRGVHIKINCRIIVGNVSRYIPVDCRDDGASHKWMVYVRTPPNMPDLSHVVNKVRFFLHPSFRPFDVVEVTSYPFRLSRRGWGEFPIRVQVHFKNPLDKPIDIIHHLVLDKTRSAIPARGAETIVRVWLHADDDLRRKFAQHEDANMERSSHWDEDSCDHDKGEQQDMCSYDENDVTGVNPSSSNASRDSGDREVNEGFGSWKGSQCDQDAFNEDDLIRPEDIKEEETDDDSNCEDQEISDSDDQDMESEGVEEEGVVCRDGEKEMGFELMPESEIKKEFPHENEFTIEEHPTNGVEIKGDVVKWTVDHIEEVGPGCSLNSKKVPDFNNSVVKKEVVIEDGCFPVPCEDDSLAIKVEPFATNHHQNNLDRVMKCSPSAAQIPIKVEGIRTQFIKSELNTQRSLLSIKGGGVDGYQRPSTSSKIWRGPVKGTSLLVRNSIIRPGTSLLIPKAKVPIATRIMVSGQAPLDAKVAGFASNYKKLRKRIHDSQEAAARHLLNSLPIVTPRACDSSYMAFYPYSVDSAEKFLSWPLAKQRASEWMRAREVRKLLSAQGFSESEEDAWTTRDIVTWARLQGYTPLSPSTRLTCARKNNEEFSAVMSSLCNTYTEPKAAQEWLNSSKNESAENVVEDDDGEEIDVVNDVPLPKKPQAGGSKGVGLGARAAGGHKVVLLGMESSLKDMPRWIDETTRQLGIVVSCPEEVAPYVFYSAAQRVLIEAVKSFMNELLRRSLSFALRRNSDSSDESPTVKVEDVCLAVLNRQEFDFLTNEGLGAEPDDSLKWDDPT